MESVLNVTVSSFKNYRETKNPKPVNLLRWLTSDKHRPAVERIRGASDKTARDCLKADLPVITPSGQFTHRENAGLIPGTHTGLVCLDIDPKHNGQIRNYTDLKAEIFKLDCVAYCGLSVSATGIFVLIPIFDPAQHRQHFKALQVLFKQAFGVTVDATPDVSRMRGYSIDENGLFRHDAKQFKGIYIEPQPPPPKAQKRFVSNANASGLWELNQVVKIAQTAQKGYRHEPIQKAAFLAGGFVGAGRLDADTAVAALETIAGELDDFRDSQRTIKDGIKAGQLKPLYDNTRDSPDFFQHKDHRRPEQPPNPTDTVCGIRYDVERMKRLYWQHWPAPPLVWQKIHAAKFLLQHMLLPVDVRIVK